MPKYLVILLIVCLAGCRDTDTPQKQRDGEVEARALPLDICMIDGKPLMPELDYIGYGATSGLVLKYVNWDGDLVLLVDDEPEGVYEGDFCQR